MVEDYAQQEETDYNKVFFLVLQHSTIRILLYIVMQFDLELVQIDIKTTFLHGDLKENINITQLDGLKLTKKKDMIYKLKNSLHSLKQSLRQQHKKFDQFITKILYTKNHFDYCVQFKGFKDGSIVYLLLQIDDMLIASKSKTEIEE